jgi:hypothetical protein
MQQLRYAEQEVLRLLKGRNQYLSIHSLDDLLGIGADSVRLFIVTENQIQSEDGQSGERLHQMRTASAKERVQKKERWSREEKEARSESTINAGPSPELIRGQMITAVRSLAFDVMRAIDEPAPSESLEQSIVVAQQRIEAYRELNLPNRVPEVLRDALSLDVIERSAPERFVFSEERERHAKDGTDKEVLAHRQVTHAVLKRLKKCVLGIPPLEHSQSYNQVERCFRLWRDAQIEKYRYEVAHPSQWHTYQMDWLSEIALVTLRSIAQGTNARLHKQAVKTLSSRGFIKPFRKKWRLTPDGERAVKYHAEKQAFLAKQKVVRE